MIPDSSVFDQSTLARLLEHDALVQRYRQFFAALDWTMLEEREATHVTADAAFDAWYVYECAARHSGIGAVPLNQHGHEEVPRDHDGVPLCPKGLRMHPTY